MRGAHCKIIPPYRMSHCRSRSWPPIFPSALTNVIALHHYSQCHPKTPFFSHSSPLSAQMRLCTPVMYITSNCAMFQATLQQGQIRLLPILHYLEQLIYNILKQHLYVHWIHSSVRLVFALKATVLPNHSVHSTEQQLSVGEPARKCEDTSSCGMKGKLPNKCNTHHSTQSKATPPFHRLADKH